MAHFARLDNNNTVIRVAKVDNVQCCDPKDGLEKEEVGIAYLQALHGKDTRWVQTSYNDRIRKNYAYKGCKYDEARDAFLTPRPFKSWTLNEETCRWEPPIPEPEPPMDGSMYLWDESRLRWDLIGPGDDPTPYLVQVLPWEEQVAAVPATKEDGERGLY